VISSTAASAEPGPAATTPSKAPPIDWLFLGVLVAWCLLQIIGYPNDIALEWDETDHVGALFPYKAFFESLFQPNLRRVPWTNYGDWGAGVAYYPPTYALLLGLVSAVFGVSMPEVRLFTIVQGGLTLWLLERCVRRYASRPVAWLSVGLLALNPWFRVFSRRLMLDVPQVCFLVGCLYYVICIETKTEPLRRRSFLLLSLPWFAFAALTRITAAPFLVGTVIVWKLFEMLRPSSPRPRSRFLDPYAVLPIGAACLAFTIWILTSNTLKASLALHGQRSFLGVLLEQNRTYLRWLFLEMDPFWGLLWAAGACWCLWRRQTLHLIALALLFVNHLTIASLHNPAGMDFRFYLPVMPFLCFAGADLILAGIARLLHVPGRSLASWQQPLWGTLGAAGLLLFGTWRYRKDEIRKIESTSSGVLQAIRGALPRMQPTSYVGIGETSEAKFFLAMLGAPNTYHVDEKLGRFAHVADLPPQWDWLIFDQAEFDRGPSFAPLLDEVRRSPDWRLEASAAGSPTELSLAEGATGFVFQRVTPTGAWAARYADHCVARDSPAGTCRRATHTPGLVAFGPYWDLQPGRYSGHVTLSISEPAANGDGVAGHIEVTTAGKRRHITDVPITANASTRGAQDVAFEVMLPVGAKYEFLVWSSGAATIDADTITVKRLP
jgi:4-amino-4-deoxy-L-arabinose transferase-like glycosyltransferase